MVVGTTTDHLDALDAHPGEAEQLPEAGAGLVVAGPARDVRVHAEAGEVERDVAGAADRDALAGEADHRHRRLG